MSNLSSLTVQSVLKLLTYDTLQELHEKIGENAYYYLIYDSRTEIIEITDISYATKIISFSIDHILDLLLTDKKVIRLDFRIGKANPKIGVFDEIRSSKMLYDVNL